MIGAQRKVTGERVNGYSVGRPRRRPVCVTSMSSAFNGVSVAAETVNHAALPPSYSRRAEDDVPLLFSFQPDEERDSGFILDIQAEHL